VLRDTTSRGLYVRVWPPHTSERRGGGGGCEHFWRLYWQEGWQGGGAATFKFWRQNLRKKIFAQLEPDMLVGPFSRGPSRP
jgi:hypothetical protein